MASYIMHQKRTNNAHAPRQPSAGICQHQIPQSITHANTPSLTMHLCSPSSGNMRPQPLQGPAGNTWQPETATVARTRYPDGCNEKPPILPCCCLPAGLLHAFLHFRRAQRSLHLCPTPASSLHQIPSRPFSMHGEPPGAKKSCRVLMRCGCRAACARWAGRCPRPAAPSPRPPPAP